MDFTDQFQQFFDSPVSYDETDIDLNKSLQDTRAALQESLSENDQLGEIIKLLYSEARVENVATDELISEIGKSLFKNVPLPRNADNLPMSEMAGYVVYYMKFLGYAARKSLENYHITKDHYETMNKSIKSNTLSLTVNRSGSIKLPELDGVKEMKRSNKTETPISPPITPPKEKEQKTDRPISDIKIPRNLKPTKNN